jgi:hypothetical protein
VCTTKSRLFMHHVYHPRRPKRGAITPSVSSEALISSSLCAGATVPTHSHAISCRHTRGIALLARQPGGGLWWMLQGRKRPAAAAAFTPHAMTFYSTASVPTDAML